ncbi:MAG: hypothetical protein JWM11_8124 [Planctomycetaceae bacterium]|nr:hypothetical protein [Planctomycetaceae bacterium]
MSGFAGSDRAGERRRRRLAVEAEGSESTEPRNSGSGDSLERFFAATGKEAVGLSPRDCPIVTVIATQAWKHWVTGALGLTAGLGLLLASHTHPQWAANLGPGIPRLLKISASPVFSWANSLILFVAAQIALLVLWARSRSLRDFDGRYRIWGWAAATWTLLSFCAATQAHQAWSETILHHFPWRALGAALWCWLVPASIWGWALALRLEQDMREDRLGYWVFLLACIWNLACVGLICQREFWPQNLNPALTQLFLAATQLVGSMTLLLSMSLHARHVLYFSAEPPPGRRRNSSMAGTRSTEPVSGNSSLFQRFLPNWMTGVKMPKDGNEEDPGDDEPTSGRRRAAPKKKSTARKTPRRSKVAAPDDSELTSKLDAAHKSAGTQLPESGTAAKNYRVDKPT